MLTLVEFKEYFQNYYHQIFNEHFPYSREEITIHQTDEEIFSLARNFAWVIALGTGLLAFIWFNTSQNSGQFKPENYPHVPEKELKTANRLYWIDWLLLFRTNYHQEFLNMMGDVECRDFWSAYFGVKRQNGESSGLVCERRVDKILEKIRSERLF